MTIEIAILFFIITSTTVLFVTEIFSVDKVALLCLAALLACNFVSPQEAVSGFSNGAVITILCLMIISAALENTGAIRLMAKKIIPLVRWPQWIAIPTLMTIVSSISAFISTTAVVIIFVRILPQIVDKLGKDLRYYLIPISFAGIMGGSITLMGTSTNLIVSEMYENSGGKGLTFFEFAVPGLLLCLAGTMLTTILTLVYFFWVKPKKEITAKQAKWYILELILEKENPWVGKQYLDTPLYKNSAIKLMNIKRKQGSIKYPSFYQRFREGDIIIIRSTLDQILELKNQPGIRLVGDSEEPEKSKSGKIVEVLILPNSRLLGKSFSQISKHDLNGALPLAIQKHKNILSPRGKTIENRISRVRLDVGDRLLVELDELNEDNWFFDDNLEIVGENIIEPPRTGKRGLSIFILLAVIGLAASGLLSILKAVFLGVAVLVAFRCITLEKAYDAISWQIIFLLACLLPIGIAMNNTGMDEFITQNVLYWFSSYPPKVLILLLFGLTMLLSGIISNNATAIIVTPIAISLANNLGLNPMVFVIAVMFSANFSFFTPVGYQTNTIIYGMGIYRFRDFLIIGGILSISLWILSSYMLPYFFPLS